MKREPENLSRYLDGELELDALPEELRREAESFERLMAPLRDERVVLPPTVRTQAMARIRSLGRSPWRRVLHTAVAWVTTPKTLSLRPVTAGLAAAVALAVLVVAWPGPVSQPDATPSATTVAGAVTRFVFVAPGARSVAVTGDFVSWDPNGVPLEDPRGNGVWAAELTLEPGLHHYVFIIDGSEWRPDPNASQVDDGFGQTNSVLLVPARSAT